METHYSANHSVDRHAGAFAVGGAAAIVALSLVLGRGDPEVMALGVLGSIIFVAPFALLAPKLPHGRAYRSAIGLALAVTFVFFWAIGAVGFMGTDGEHPADVVYVLVPIVGMTAAVLARFQPKEMVRAMCATAVAQMLVPTIAVAAGLNLMPISPVELIWFTLIVNGPVTALYLGSAWLFRRASREM